MKKIVLSVIVALIAITANAQVYVGGTFGVGSDKVETEGTEVRNTTFKILPEVGYELSEDWSVGTVVGYEYNKSGDVKTNTFTIVPYARYFFLSSNVVRLFADGGFGFSTSKTKGNDALNSWNIGIKPGILPSNCLIIFVWLLSMVSLDIPKKRIMDMRVKMLV